MFERAAAWSPARQTLQGVELLDLTRIDVGDKAVSRLSANSTPSRDGDQHRSQQQQKGLMTSRTRTVEAAKAIC